MKEKVADKMQELIKINISHNGKQLISARELHEFLKVKEDFTNWIKRQLESVGAVENKDFSTHTFKRERQILHEYVINIQIAKEICMVCGVAPRTNEETKKLSKEARQYFIACEKKLKQLTTDSYMIQDPIERAKAWIKEEEQRQLLAAQIEKDKPKVLFANAVASSKTSILVGELAKILKQNGVKTGPKRLFTWMRDNGYLIKRKGTDYNMPTQKSMEQGLFEIKETSITHSDGHITVTKTPKVTGKGQQYFINKFVG